MIAMLVRLAPTVTAPLVEVTMLAVTCGPEFPEGPTWAGVPATATHDVPVGSAAVHRAGGRRGGVVDRAVAGGRAIVARRAGRAVARRRPRPLKLDLARTRRDVVDFEIVDARRRIEALVPGEIAAAIFRRTALRALRQRRAGRSKQHARSDGDRSHEHERRAGASRGQPPASCAFDDGRTRPVAECCIDNRAAGRHYVPRRPARTGAERSNPPC